MATLATPVGAPSLGNYIFSGLQTRNHTAVLVGCAAAAVLALCLDALLRAVEAGVRRRRPALVATALAVLGALYAYAAVTLARGLAGPAEAPVVVGAKTFTEQYVLSELLAGRIARLTGRATRIVPSLGSTVAFDALRAGTIDTYVDYSGTLWATVLRREGPPPERRVVLREVGAALRRDHGVTLVAALGFENAYALAVRAADAARLGLRRIGDLAAHAPRMSIGGDYEFFARPEWASVRRLYGLRFQRQRSMDASLMYTAVAEGAVDVISAFSTDGRLAALALVLLEDDRGAIPPYDAVVLVSARLVRESPAVVRALATLDGTIDAARMRRMNLAVDEGGESPRAVAEELLRTLSPAGP
jgi:osmoprotectant transport system permease protein